MNVGACRGVQSVLAGLLAGLLLSACVSAPPPPASATKPGENSASPEQNRARIHTDLGAAYFARGQYAVALDALNRALAVEPQYAPAYNILGLVRAELREEKEAEAAFRRALELSPQYSEAHNNFGLYLCMRNRIDEAMPHFEKALANPLYATPDKALVNAGACSLNKGDLNTAENFLQRAFKRAPENLQAVLGVAEMDFRRGRLLAARAKLKQLAEATELNAQGLWLGVRTERLLKDRDAEASYAAQLQRRFPEAMQTQWWMLGQFEQGGSLL